MIQPENILLTGGTGLIGRSITQALSFKGWKTQAIYRNKIIPSKNISWIKYDILSDSTNDLFSKLEKVDIIIHNAASLSMNQEDNSEIDQTNIKFTEDLLKFAVNNRVKKILFTSTLSSIRKPLPDLITEESEIAAFSAYSESKLAGEKLIQRYCEKYGIKYCILRVASPVVNNLELMPNTVIKKWIDQSTYGKTIKIYGTGNRTQNFVSVTDISNAFLKCIENMDTIGIFNIASNDSISMLEIAEMITKKYKNTYEFTGIDDNEKDKWNISIEKARKLITYSPEFSSKEVILNLLNSI